MSRSAWRLLPFELVVNITAILLAAFVAIIPAFKAGDYWLPAAYMVPHLVVALLFMRYVRRLRPKPFRGAIFGALGAAEEAKLWRRRQLAAEAIAHIANERAHVSVFSGQSGAGKTSLLRYEIAPVLRKRNWQIVVIDDYSNLRSDFEDALADAFPSVEESKPWLTRLLAGLIDGPSTAARLVVFDQAEQLAYQELDVIWFRNAVRELIDDGVRVALIVRKDYFYDLRFLGDLLPHVGQVFEIPGMSVESGTTDFRRVSSSLSHVATPALVDRIVLDLAASAGGLVAADRERRDGAPRRVTPLHLQLVGTVLEQRATEHGGRLFDIADYEAMGGAPPAVFRSFFADHVAAAPDPDAARLVLFALAVPRGLRMPLTAAEICSATYLSYEMVIAQLHFFAAYGLLVVQGRATFQWSHDSLPEMYRSYASVEVLAGLRAVITDRVEALSPIAPVSRAVRSVEETSREAAWATGIFVFILVMIASRFVLAFALPEKIGPCSYLIVMPPHAAWAGFVYNLTRNLFIRVSRKYLLIGWPSLAVLGVGAIVAACVQPCVWIASMGAIGLPIGLNLWFLQRKAAVARQSREQFRSIGVNFIGIGIVMLIGGIFVRFTAEGAGADAALFTMTSFTISALFVGISWNANRKYAGRTEAAVWLGFIDHR
jgi:hypothetical protein